MSGRVPQTVSADVDQSTDLTQAPFSGSTTTDAGGHQVFLAAAEVRIRG